MLLVSTAGDPGWRRLSRVIARLPRLLRDVRSHPGWFLFFFLFGRLMPARRLVAAMASWRAGLIAPTGEVCRGDLAGPPVASAVAALRQDGICPDLRLSEAVVTELQALRPQPSLLWRARLAYALFPG